MTRTAKLPTHRDPDWYARRDAWMAWLQTVGINPETTPVGARVTVDDEAGTVTVQVLALRHGRPYMDVETGEPAVEDLVVVQDGPVAPFPQMVEAGGLDHVDVYRLGPDESMNCERWVVAEDQAWLPGVYATEEAARLAVSFSYSELERLGTIYRVDGENRPVTVDDLRKVNRG